MSYDLFLRPAAAIDANAFRAHFADRPNYAVNDAGTQAWYENVDTGTYFSFELTKPAPADDGEATAYVAFNMNYFRPHVFGLEAASHIADFVEAFACAVDDPQAEGMGNTFSEDGFIDGWNKGNVFGYGLLRERSADNQPAPRQTFEFLKARLRENGCLMADARDIKRTWLWNYARVEMEREFEELGDDVFVPRIFWAARQDAGEPLNFVVWGEGVPTLIPDVVSHIVVALTAPASRGLLARLVKGSAQNSSETRHFLIERDTIMKLAPSECDSWSGLGFARLGSGPEELPQDFLADLQQSWPATDARKQVSVFQAGALRDAELVREALAASQ